MNNIKLGFIGAGNMGSALINGIVKSGTVNPACIFAYDVDTEKTKCLKDEVGINISSCSVELVENSGYIVLAVKPNYVKSALESCKKAFDESKVLVSIAAGVPISAYKEILGDNIKIVRAMPNTPALVGEGMTVLSFDGITGRQEKDMVIKLFECVGKVEELEEKYMSEVTALTGSSPAYVFMFIEAMADAAVKMGMPRNLSYKMAAQAVLGSAKMVLETGRHPGELKDQVCSPAGTTIEAVATLEKNGFRYAVIDAVAECAKKAREIGKIYG